MIKRFFFQEWREAAGLTQKQLGKLIGLSKTQISRIENGERDFTGDFLADFQQAVGNFEIGDPLNRPPASFANGHTPKVTDEDVEARLFTRAKEIRKALRAQKDKPKLPAGKPKKPKN